MIVRIMGEGQLFVADEFREELNALDSVVEQSVDSGDLDHFGEAFTALLAAVRRVGEAVEEDFLHDSDLILPPADATLEEVRGLLGDDGLIPG